MNLLILTQYFPPETGAPQNRLFELAVRLKRLGHHVDVLTAMPNYPQMKIYPEYKGKLGFDEQMEGMSVRRSFIYASKSKSIFARLLNYFSFVISSFFAGLFWNRKWDLIICESPPLFLGFSAVFLSKMNGAKLVFNVSDLWPESAEKLELVTNQTMLNLAYWLESWCYRNSVLVTGQTQGIVKDINHRFKSVPTYWLPNGVDLSYYNPEKINSNWRTENGFSNQDLILGYAGIIGHAQGLELLLKAATRLKDHSHIKIVMIGEGPVKSELMLETKHEKLENVFFLSGVGKSEMPEVISGIDVALIPLRKLELFKGAIPSKIFENLAMQKPILLGVDGEARKLFIDEANAGWYFEPENVDQLVEAILAADRNRDSFEALGKNGRDFVKKNFERTTIAASFNQRLQKLDL
jgi:glycosyltransferase involved in cell wall biosynthesis